MKWYHTTVFTCVSWVRFPYPQLFLYAILLLFERRAEMERLTERFDNGQAAVMGCGENCKYDYKYCRNHYEDCPEINRLYERLAEYEDTGLTPQEIMELKDRDTAKPPIDIEDNYGFFVCPSCGNSIYASDDFESHKFCLNCGQRIQWRE